MQNVYFEIIAFFYALKHPEIISNFKKEFFSEPTINGIFDNVKEFIKQYNIEPTAEQVFELVRINGKDDVISKDSISMLWNNKSSLSQYGEDWLNTSITGWGQWRSFYTGLERTIAYVQTLPQNVSFDAINDYIQKAKQIFTNGATFAINHSEGHDFFSTETHKLTKLNTRTSGYNFIDLSLNGGYSNKQLIVLMGSPKVGKSQWLCNLAAKSVINGFNTLYISLEMSYQKVAQRIGANIYNINIDEYNSVVNDPVAFQQRIDAARCGTMFNPGQFFIEEFPTSTATASDIEAFALSIEERLSTPDKPFKFHNIFIDYINIMRDQKNPNSENTYQKIKSICEDVRACAQRNEWAIISVTQTNRQGMDASDLDMANISESAGLIATVDALFGIIRTPVMMAENCYYLKGIALRDSKHMGDKKRFDFDPNYLRIEENMMEDIIPCNMDIPISLRSATFNAASKAGNTQYNKPSPNANTMQSVYSVPVTGQPAPGLAATEQQMQAKQLFGF